MNRVLDENDPVRMAILAVLDTLNDFEARLDPIRDRLTKALELRDHGAVYSEMGSQLEGSPVIGTLTTAIDALIEAAARLRRTAAVELHDEGMTMDQIATLFGVSRQRVSSILREARKGVAQLESSQ